MQPFNSLLVDEQSYANYLHEQWARPDLEDIIYTPRTREIHELLYFVLRSTMAIAKDSEEAVIKHHEQWRRICHDHAAMLAVNRRFLADPPRPNWVDETVRQLVELMRPEYPEAADIDVVVTLESRIMVRAHPARNRVRISLLTRDLLRLINLCTWNEVDSWRAMRSTYGAFVPGYPGGELLPYLLPLYWEIPWHAVPMPRAFSPLAARGSMVSARLQVNFMLAHEFAHVLLHHDRPSPENEIEADRFAYDLLFRRLTDDITVGDVWTATRWLSEILAIERLTSWRLSGNDGEPASDPDSRRSLLYPFARSAGPSMIDVDLGGRGLIFLSQVRSALAASSAADVRQQALDWKNEIRDGGASLIQRQRMLRLQPLNREGNHGNDHA